MRKKNNLGDSWPAVAQRRPDSTFINTAILGDVLGEAEKQGTQVKSLHRPVPCAYNFKSLNKNTAVPKNYGSL